MSYKTVYALHDPHCYSIALTFRYYINFTCLLVSWVEWSTLEWPFTRLNFFVKKASRDLCPAVDPGCLVYAGYP